MMTAGNQVLSQAQADIVQAIGDELKPMALAVTDKLMVESIGRVDQLLRDLHVAPIHEESEVIELRGRHIELHGRHIVIYGEWPRQGIPPETVTIRVVNCSWEKCGGAFTLDNKQTSREFSTSAEWFVQTPEWRRFHARRCLVAWHNMNRKLLPPETPAV
jgi:hypothetical protein